jgi:proteasome lid subunit RPN8/RPN11
MLEHARARPGEEVCGLLGAKDGAFTSFHPVANVAEDRTRRFLMDARGQIDAMRRMREDGEELLGIFHSHPEGPGEPSAEDLAMAAYPGTIYFIAAPEAGAGTWVLRAFRYDGTGFTGIAVN